MPPAARVGDLHTCPIGSGPLIGPGVPTVHIGYMPAIVVGDACTCVAPEMIFAGSTTVTIAGRAAARMGDPTSSGGAISAGCPTVFIGG